MAGSQPELLQLTNSNENGSEALFPCRMLNQSLNPIPQVVRSRSWSRPDKPSWMDKAVKRFLVIVLVCLLIYLFMLAQTQRSEIQSLRSEFRKKSDNTTSLLMVKISAKIDQIMEEVNATLDGTVEDTKLNLSLIMDEIAVLRPLLEDVEGIKTSLYDLENRSGINIEEVFQDRFKGFFHDLLSLKVRAKAKEQIEEYGYGYTKVGDYGHFKKMHEAKKFVDANADCAAIQGHLLDFGGLSQAEFDKTLKALRDAGIFGMHDRMIALHEPTAIEGHWVWSWSQQPLDTNWSVWNDGEPNNEDDNKDEEDCVIVYLNDLKLNDVACNSPKHFICQMTE